MPPLLRYPHAGCIVGLVYARNLSLGPSPAELLAAIAQATSLAEPSVNEGKKGAVRELLRAAGYKPSGRGKPASEYLEQAAREGRFPQVNSAVDCVNLVSLSSGLPISILDARAFGASPDSSLDHLSAMDCLLRAGRPGETYVFNQSGQSIDLAGLLCACALPEDRPIGNAVKDSMLGKLRESSDQAICFLYGSLQAIETQAAMEGLCQSLASLLSRHCGAETRTGLAIQG